MASPGINVDKTPGLHSATTVRLQQRHVGFTHLSRKGFFASRVKHSSNSTSTFQITRIALSGDVSMNPGPPKCSACDKTIARNNCAVECNTCHRRLHINCGKVKPIEFDKDLETLNTRLEHELGIANNWYERNGMIVNPEKHQAMVLGANSNYEFSFSVKNSIDLLGVTIDKDLSFNRHISQICEKVNKQFSVLKRFKNIITSNVMLRPYKAFILPHFQYCSLIWHFSGTTNCDKLESLNKRILRFIFNDSLSSYDELLKKAKIASLYTGRLHKILMVVFKSLFVSTYPGYLKELFVFRNSSYSLRGKNILTLPIPRTTNYGLECIRYQAAKMRTMTSFKDFKKAIKETNF